MRRRATSLVVAALTCVLVGSGLVTAGAVADAPVVCGGARVLDDPVGDDFYGGVDTGLESDSADIVALDAYLGDAHHVFVTSVADLGPTQPQHFDLRVDLALLGDDGTRIVLTSRRSAATGETLSVVVGGRSVPGGWVVHDEVADTIRMVVPARAFDGQSSVVVATHHTRYDSGAVLSPLADEASGGCTLGLRPGFTLGAAEDHAGLDVKLLVIDSGINGLHPEFRRADGSSRLFAWWDFSAFAGDDDHPAAPGAPRSSERWFDTDGDGHLVGDPDDPYDPDGHGSAVASMAAGLNLHRAKSASACPGCQLAFAKIYDQGADSLNGSIADAIRWGTDALGVDVISVSIGQIVPAPGFVNEQVLAAIEHAHAEGVSVLFANGNGWGNAGVPGQPGGLQGFGYSTKVLSVGADGTDSFLVTTDPEVVAIFSVHAAAATGTGYQDISGTSFSTPFTAGVVARVIGTGRACGAPAADIENPNWREGLMKRTARDRPEVPPSHEGYGVIDRTTMALALDVVCGGAERPGLHPGNHTYVTQVSGRQRQLSSETLRFS